MFCKRSNVTTILFIQKTNSSVKQRCFYIPNPSILIATLECL
jgi:hypothetical protein